jgi:hypothetical protein
MATKRILGGYIGWHANCSLRGPSVDYGVLATPHAGLRRNFYLRCRLVAF